MSKQAMKLALEHAKRDERHMNHAETRYWCRIYRDIAEKAIEALAEQPAQQEPVAWVREHELPLAPGDAFSWVETFVHKTPLYKSQPPRKPWLGLTDEEIIDHFRTNVGTGSLLSFADGVRYAEAKLREKNT